MNTENCSEKKKEYYIHPEALVETDKLGCGTRIWAFAHVLEGAVIGDNCNIGDHCFIEGGVTIGNDVVIKNGVSIWEGVSLEDRVFVGPNVVFTNDTRPRAKVFHENYEQILIRYGASIGANATLVCPLTIGRHAMIGAGSVVTNDVPDFGLVYGNPARLVGFVCKCGQHLCFDNGNPAVATCRCGLKYVRRNETVEWVDAVKSFQGDRAC